MTHETPRRRLLTMVQAAPWRSAATLGELADTSPHHAGGLLSQMAAEGLIRQAAAMPSDRTPADGCQPRYVYGPLGRTADLPTDRLRAMLTLLDLARDEFAAAIVARDDASRWAS